METKDTPKPPIEKFQLGRIHVSVWETTTKDGGTFRTFTCERRYLAGKNDSGDKVFKSSTSYSSRDVDDLKQVLERVGPMLADT